jgi:Ca2+-transporting ATPase
VAKESSDMILLDNNFKVIVAAVQEGRKIFSTLRRVVTYLTSDAFCEIVLVTGSIILAAPLPILPAQILWLNIIHDGMPNFALSFEKSTKAMMERKPRKRDSSLLSPEMKAIIFLVGMLVNVIIFIFFFRFLGFGMDLEYLRTLIFAILGAKSLFAIFALRSLSRPIWRMNPFGNMYLWGAVGISTALFLAAIYWSPLQSLLGTTSLAFNDWSLVFFFSALNLFLIEITKLYYSSPKRRNA